MKGLMTPNIENIKKLIKEKFSGDYRNLARELDVDSTTVYRAITKRTSAGTKFLPSLMVYCKQNNLDFDSYIFLAGALLQSNESKPKSKTKAG